MVTVAAATTRRQPAPVSLSVQEAALLVSVCTDKQETVSAAVELLQDPDTDRLQLLAKLQRLYDLGLVQRMSDEVFVTPTGAQALRAFQARTVRVLATVSRHLI